ncbi:DUF3209 family protein [Pseudobacteriovorax antillogorgiicola]|uniref:DUF3209 domain-containing protein n=1 Tax=Pseudobacteriovorax antillogorgiicola TaxID=1513793 RepID=A0A1Y6C128_9BACT|nr:DUF3209 family protein [Pseudobacteriovorax antillogorgiicola]TCS50671.1 uncharacterized protein DUF3209 [Pseudobacteriovorax antillogorgiicola]SMF40011.1 Protein of unknown function [Pseudobacteriovorax antillogorgiicola]
MACHEIAALRLGMMNVIGIDNEAEKQHELEELGPIGLDHGPLKSLTEAATMGELQQYFESSLTLLEEKVSQMSANDKKLPYYRSLLVMTKKVELDLRNQMESVKRLYEDLEEMHDFMHEIYPAN